MSRQDRLNSSLGQYCSSTNSAIYANAQRVYSKHQEQMLSQIYYCQAYESQGRNAIAQAEAQAWGTIIGLAISTCPESLPAGSLHRKVVDGTGEAIDSTCLICIGEATHATDCRHALCWDCVKSYLGETCPACRREVSWIKRISTLPIG
jgi:hypothetical protein